MISISQEVVPPTLVKCCAGLGQMSAPQVVVPSRPLPQIIALRLHFGSFWFWKSSAHERHWGQGLKLALESRARSLGRRSH